MIMTDMQLLRVYVDESDKWKGRPLYLALVELCRAKGIAGATVLRGVAGYGHHGTLHTDRLLDISHHLPMIVEVIDAEEEIQAALPDIRSMVGEGMITLENIMVASLP